MKILETLQTKSKEDAKKAIFEQLSVRAIDVLNEVSKEIQNKNTLHSIADKKSDDAEMYQKTNKE